MEKELISNVWAASGWIVSYTAGVLTLHNGLVSFLTAKGEEFNIPLTEIKNVKWPKMQFGYGVHIDVNGKTYKFTFMQPNGQSRLDEGLITSFGRIANGVSAIKSLAHMKEYKQVAKEWREIVGG
jgi:hypothetical protein